MYAPALLILLAAMPMLPLGLPWTQEKQVALEESGQTMELRTDFNWIQEKPIVIEDGGLRTDFNQSSQPKAGTSSEPPHHKNKVMAWVLGGIGVMAALAIIVCCIWVFCGRCKGDQNVY